ncbi:tRNA pseudouridine(55) synthase TruB [Alloscardovia criceti]|uniref:tRNA pseudouridine(55) synthase TruB n=1 Tax=Alloscardovia criceti TaxID=356828 RepID=UPI0003630580|nr:tRNA pseudouridine(55) synthase TruB [Alloscardovia criceti]
MEKSGVIVVDKPQGVTSHDVVAACRSLLHTSKVGHAGTLDPMATGVLVIGFGSATRLLNAIVGSRKTYHTTILLGQRTTTDDADGDIIPWDAHEQDAVTAALVGLDRHRIEQEISAHFLGDIDQVPSSFSAKKIAGKRAYDLARSGQEVELKAQKITIDDFCLTDMRRRADGLIEVDASVRCSAGTYIRALGRDLGHNLGVGGSLIMLRRVQVGEFDVGDARTLSCSTQTRSFTNKHGEEVTRRKVVFPQEFQDAQRLEEHIISPAWAAQHTLPWCELSAEQAVDISFGRPIRMHITQQQAALYNGHLMALIEPWKKNLVKPSTVFITSTQLANLVQEA